MTKIVFYETVEGGTTGFECSGHTGSEERGKDILCSAVSALCQSVCLGLKSVLKLKPKIVKRDGYLKVSLKTENKQAEILFETLYISLKDIEKGNEKFLQIKKEKK